MARRRRNLPPPDAPADAPARQVRRRVTPPAGQRARCTPEQAAALDALYAELPEIDCQGRCWDSCGPIRMAEPERARITRATGITIRDGHYTDGPVACPALTMLHQCAAYDVRPMICRLWGLIENLPCTYGCRPTRVLTAQEGYEFIARSLVIGGDRNALHRVRRHYATPEQAAHTNATLDAMRDEQLMAYNAERANATRPRTD